MIVVRRLYVYLICIVSLFVLAIGVTNLLELAIAQAWEAMTGTDPLLGTGTDIRREVSLYLALVAVSLPIWLLHWYLAERWAALDRDDSDRGSGIRAIFFAVVLGVAAGNWVSHLGSLLSAGLSRILDSGGFYPATEIIGAIAILIVSVAIWTYHGLIRSRDTSSMVMTGTGVWPVRFYMYLASFVGAMLMLAGVAQLLAVAVDAVVGGQTVVTGESWWAGSVATALPLVLVGGLVWAIHWTYSLQLVYGEDWRALSEQTSALRRAYLYVAVLAGVAVTLVAASISLAEALREIFGVDPGPAADPLWARVVRPLLIALPFALFWWMHRRVIAEEADRFASQPDQVAVARLYTYVVSFLALAFTAVGLAYLVGVLIEFAFERARILDIDPDWVPEQISYFLSITLIGGAVWLWHWLAVQRRAAADPAGEGASTSRRVYIYLVLTATTLATLAALAVVLYQALQIVLGVRSAEGIASDIGSLIGVVLVAGALLVYHVLILRHDLRLEPEAEPLPAEAPAGDVPVLSLPLILRGPENFDFESTVQDFRRRLPEGVELLVDEDRLSSGNPEDEETGEFETVSYDVPDHGETETKDDNPRIFG